MDSRSPNSISAKPILAVMRVPQPLPTVTKTTPQVPVTNTMRATAMTVVLAGTLTHPGYAHWGLNE
jgi:hypothetical protein